MPRRSVYRKPTEAAPKIDARFVDSIKVMIEENPSFGYRRVALLPGFTKTMLQRIFQ